MGFVVSHPSPEKGEGWGNYCLWLVHGAKNRSRSFGSAEERFAHDDTAKIGFVVSTLRQKKGEGWGNHEHQVALGSVLWRIQGADAGRWFDRNSFAWAWFAQASFAQALRGWSLRG
jgi:hypothetical protein